MPRRKMRPATTAAQRVITPVTVPARKKLRLATLAERKAICSVIVPRKVR